MDDAIAHRLRSERERLELSQEELANAGEVQKNAQSNYERGIRFPDTRYLARIAKVGVDVQYVLNNQRANPDNVTPAYQRSSDNLSRLKEERLRLGLSQAELAELGGVGRTSQVKYEANERHPDTAYLVRVANAGIDIQYVVTGERISSTTPPEYSLAAIQQDANTLKAMPLEDILALIGLLTEEAQRKATDVRRVING